MTTPLRFKKKDLERLENTSPVGALVDSIGLDGDVGGDCGGETCSCNISVGINCICADTICGASGICVFAVTQACADSSTICTDALTACFLESITSND